MRAAGRRAAPCMRGTGAARSLLQAPPQAHVRLLAGLRAPVSLLVWHESVLGGRGDGRRGGRCRAAAERAPAMRARGLRYHHLGHLVTPWSARVVVCVPVTA